eukprot:9508833-Lingulodinium_polyedra.AAC.1
MGLLCFCLWASLQARKESTAGANIYVLKAQAHTNQQKPDKHKQQQHRTQQAQNILPVVGSMDRERYNSSESLTCGARAHARWFVFFLHPQANLRVVLASGPMGVQEGL